MVIRKIVGAEGLDKGGDHKKSPAEVHRAQEHSAAKLTIRNRLLRSVGQPYLLKTAAHAAWRDLRAACACSISTKSRRALKRSTFSFICRWSLCMPLAELDLGLCMQERLQQLPAA